MNLRPLLSDLYPENSFGGECGLFARTKLADIPPVGNSYSDKKATVKKYGILSSQLEGQYRVGDVLITSEGTNWLGQGYGHVAFINNIIGETLYLTESNFKLDGRVHHTRTLPLNSSVIYGILRKPFKFKLPPLPIVLNVNVFMNYEIKWNSKIFKEWADRVKQLSGGKLELNLFPLYTYNSLKNWWYEIQSTDFGGEFKVIAKHYINEQLLPLQYPNINFILWAITNKQWHGSVLHNPNSKEYGWYYGNSKVATIACDENDKSFKYTETAFVHYGTHELCHFLEQYGRRDGRKMTDIYDIQESNLAKVFQELEYDFLQVNI